MKSSPGKSSPGKKGKKDGKDDGKDEDVEEILDRQRAREALERKSLSECCFDSSSGKLACANRFQELSSHGDDVDSDGDARSTCGDGDLCDCDLISSSSEDEEGNNSDDESDDSDVETWGPELEARARARWPFQPHHGGLRVAEPDAAKVQLLRPSIAKKEYEVIHDGSDDESDELYGPHYGVRAKLRPLQLDHGKLCREQDAQGACPPSPPEV